MKNKTMQLVATMLLIAHGTCKTAETTSPMVAVVDAQPLIYQTAQKIVNGLFEGTITVEKIEAMPEILQRLVVKKWHIFLNKNKEIRNSISTELKNKMRELAKNLKITGYSVEDHLYAGYVPKVETKLIKELYEAYKKSGKELLSKEEVKELIGRQILLLNDRRINDLIGLEKVPNIQKVEWLYLSNNKISHIPETIFNRLENLQYLFIENNQLSEEEKTKLKKLLGPKVTIIFDKPEKN